METLALAIIAKDEIEALENIILKYYTFFDEICIAIDDDEAFDKLHNKYKSDSKVRFYRYKWRDDFAHKRNFLATKIKSDYYFRIDTDDEIVNPDGIKSSFKKAVEQGVDIVYCYYIYSKDEWGNCNAAHYRETIIKKTDNLYWNKAIHENLLPKSTANHRIVIDKDIKIDHNIDAEHARKSAERNVKFLLKEYNQDGDDTDPRTLAYLGRMLLGVGELQRARKFLELHIAKSGWDEDRYISWCQLAEIAKQVGEHDQAIGAAFEAIQERPNYPDAYLRLHDIYFDKQQYKKAIYWGEEGLKKPIPQTFTLLDPSAYSWRPILSLAFCYLQISDFEKAKKLFDIAAKAAPTLDFIVKNKVLFEKAVEHKRYVDHIAWLVHYLKEKDDTKLIPLMKSVPAELDENEIIIKMKNSILPACSWADKSVVIFCGDTSEAWSPKSVNTGIGGSEEAAIQMSKELTKLGYEVTVYNNCGEEEGVHDGVHYLNHTKFNKEDSFNIFISWRMNIFTFGVKAKKKIIWLHDLPFNISFDKKSMDSFDKIVVLSKYHASLLPKNVPAKKIYVSTNGLVPDDFKDIKNIVKQRNRLIYASSYNRGLETLLEMWGDIKKEVPDSELHVYYGWQVYDNFVLKGLLKDNGFKKKMQKLMNQDGVFEHGRVGHKELLKEYATSDIFAYPCCYKGEINCIALTKAIACGCLTVTNDFAVLKERNSSFAVSDDKFKNNLLEFMKSSRSVKSGINYKYVDEMSWATIANQWDKELLQ